MQLDEREPQGEQVWSASDERAFTYVRDFGGSLPFISLASHINGSELRDLYENLHRFNAALPFSEGERRWAMQSFTAGRLLGELDPVKLWTPFEVDIISAGKRQRLVGRELVRRWPAWRRSAAEFESGDGLREATESIRLVGQALLAGVDL